MLLTHIPKTRLWGHKSLLQAGQGSVLKSGIMAMSCITVPKQEGWRRLVCFQQFAVALGLFCFVL